MAWRLSNGFALALALLALAFPVRAEITGVATVIDGDTLEIRRQRGQSVGCSPDNAKAGAR